MRLIYIICFIFLGCVGTLKAVKLSDLAAALDMSGQSGIELVSFKKRVYKLEKDKDFGDYDYKYDENDDYVYTDTNNEGWTVQSSASDHSKYTAYPVMGGSCVRSALPVKLEKASDAQEAWLVFKVYGPGTFSFYYKTSCDVSDTLYAIVDNEFMPFSATGYGDFVEDELVNEEITIDAGPATDGPYNGTYYHEVKFIFEKDLPKYFDGDYIPDGPIKPDKDEEGYKELLEEYKAELATFFNSVWLDCVQWTPEVLEFSLENNETMGIDSLLVIPETNAARLGYSVRFTTDGSTPNSRSELYDADGNGEGIEVTKTSTLKMAVFRGDILDRTTGNQGIHTLNLTIQASTPTLTVDSDASTASKVVLRATSGFAENQIVYTTDGSEPTATSAHYDASKGIEITRECIVKARCIRANVTMSETASFQVEALSAPVCALRNSSGKVEPYGVTTESRLTLAVEGSTENLYYGNSENAITNPYANGLTVAAGSRLYLRNQKQGNLSSAVVSVEAKAANSTVKLGAGNYALENGWNLVSFPVELTLASMNAILEWAPLEYDVDLRSYQRATAICPGGAYWIYNSGDGKTVTLKGYLTTTPASLVVGWNAIGIVTGQKSFDSKRVWGYSGGRYQILQGNPHLWKGYFVEK